MLTGRLPYGTHVSRANSRASQRRLHYQPAGTDAQPVPAWVDGALRKAVHSNPAKRYDALSAFTHDLRHPNPDFTEPGRRALLERNPLLFWRGLSLLLFLIILVLWATRPVPMPAATNTPTPPTGEATAPTADPQSPRPGATAGCINAVAPPGLNGRDTSPRETHHDQD